MFGRRKDDLAVGSGFPSDNPISSILGKDLTITGNLQFSGKARIDGKIEGDVKGDCLILSEDAKIIGNLEVESLVCQGKIEGDVSVKTLLIKAGGIIKGGCTVEDLVVESGGIIYGEVTVPKTELHILEGKQEKVSPPSPLLQEKVKGKQEKVSPPPILQENVN
ncbi:MAG: polymer-forming cytoskeletal protein [Deltaproteobacteria bacterium]